LKTSLGVLDAYVLQIWVGPHLPSPIVLECMRRTRKAAKHYTLICAPDSLLLEELRPDVVQDSTKLYREALTAYKRAEPYLLKFKHDPRQVSEVLRFYALYLMPALLYVDADCLVHDDYDKVKRVKGVILARFRDQADIFLIHGGGDSAFFDRALNALDVGRGASVLSDVTRSHKHRFNLSVYTHLTRSRHHEPPVFL
jgi:hypothetical protein